MAVPPRQRTTRLISVHGRESGRSRLRESPRLVLIWTSFYVRQASVCWGRAIAGGGVAISLD